MSLNMNSRQIKRCGIKWNSRIIYLSPYELKKRSVKSAAMTCHTLYYFLLRPTQYFNGETVVPYS